MLQGDITATLDGLMTNNPQEASRDEWNEESKLSIQLSHRASATQAMEVPQGGPQTSLICDGLSAYGPFPFQ